MMMMMKMKYDEHPMTDCHYDFNGWHFRNSRSDVSVLFLPPQVLWHAQNSISKSSKKSVAEIIPKFQKICVRSGAPDV